jgi:hypothetical protein
LMQVSAAPACDHVCVSNQQGNLSFLAQCANHKEKFAIPGTKQRFSGERVNQLIDNARRFFNIARLFAIARMSANMLLMIIFALFDRDCPESTEIRQMTTSGFDQCFPAINSKTTHIGSWQMYIFGKSQLRLMGGRANYEGGV